MSEAFWFQYLSSQQLAFLSAIVLRYHFYSFLRHLCVDFLDSGHEDLGLVLVGHISRPILVKYIISEQTVWSEWSALCTANV